ncbi:TetR-like C-terminal domain-containing protein [Streptacidiphilus sp. EB103A]|uniref:TetR-like C-terminal domain-containing protein n=1 Tax=Streptacidiphilus sp. EB103A TaxID=3156275 RepID=UPI003516D5AB
MRPFTVQWGPTWPGITAVTVAAYPETGMAELNRRARAATSSVPGLAMRPAESRFWAHSTLCYVTEAFEDHRLNRALRALRPERVDVTVDRIHLVDQRQDPIAGYYTWDVIEELPPQPLHDPHGPRRARSASPWLRYLLRDAFGAVPVTGDASMDVRALALAYRIFALQGPTRYAFMFEQAVPKFDPGPDLRARALESTFGVLAAAVAQADAQATPERGAYLLWTAMHGMVSIELTHRDRTELPGWSIASDWEGIYLDGVRAVWNGLAL